MFLFFLFWGREDRGAGRGGQGKESSIFKKTQYIYIYIYMSILFINQFPFEFTGHPIVRKWADVGWDRGLVGFLRTWPTGHVFGVCRPQGCACGMQVGPWPRACRVPPGTVERRYSQNRVYVLSCCIYYIYAYEYALLLLLHQEIL